MKANARQAALAAPSASAAGPKYRETPDVAEATGRLIRTVGKRVATEDPDGLDCLSLLETKLREAWRIAVDGLRGSGFTDREIGRQLGMTRQAIEQRWPRGQHENGGIE